MANTIVPVFRSKAAAIRTARETVGGLGNPSKMPGFAYGLSPALCQTGGKLRSIPGSACSDCYACKGRYTTTDKDGNPGSVAQAHANRFASIEAEGLDKWADRFVTLLNGLLPFTPAAERFFRWHDAGDLQSVEHLSAIASIARRCPDWRFWLPTQEHGYVRQWLRAGNLCPENLTIRESAPMRGRPIVGSTGCTSYIEPDETLRKSLPYRCTAPETNGQCLDCRSCWDKAVPVVAYKAH